MTAVILSGVIRSQRTVGVILLTLAVVAIVASNRPEAPGDTLAAASLLMLPVHAWTALITATGTDAPTREAFVAAVGVRRVMVGHVLAAVIVGAVASLAVLGVGAGLHVMSPQPSAAQWAAGAMVGGAGLMLGVAIGTVAGPPVIHRRGTRVLVLVGLVVLAPLSLPLLRLARDLGEVRSNDVIGAVAGPAAATAAAAAVLVAGALVVAGRRL